MANIAIIGDVHANYRRLAVCLALLEGNAFDLAVLTGDVGLDPPWGSRDNERGAHDDSVRRVTGSVREALDCPVVFVPGNHDLRDPPATADAVNVDGAVLEVSGLSIAGLGGAGPAHFGFPYEWTEIQAESALNATFDGVTKAPDILLSHTPPANTSLDRTMHGAHVGSEAVRQRIEVVRPRLVVCGHIHEAWGVDRVADVPCINAGALGPPAEQNIAWHVTWNEGPRRIRMHLQDADGKTGTRSFNLEDSRSA